MLAVAREFQRPLTPRELLDLLPATGPASESELRSWVGNRPELLLSFQGAVEGMGGANPDPLSDERRSRAVDYLGRATSLFRTTLAPFRQLVSCVAVTGSITYGQAGPDDDCDFLVVTRDGAAWVYLALALARLRLRRFSKEGRTDPIWCINYVVDDSSARRDYIVPRGFLFAREALLARPLEGAEYYRRLLGSAAWLQTETPRLWARWKLEGIPEELSPSRSSGLGVRFLNAAIFPFLAAYLQAVGLVRNARHRRAGDAASLFRTVTRPDRMAFLVDRFDSLRKVYARASATRPGSGARARAPGGGRPGPTGPSPAPPPRPSEAREDSGILSG